MLNFLLRRRAFLGLPLTSLAAYFITGLLGLSANANGNRVWRINASSYASGIRNFFELLKSSATSGSSLPVSSVMWYFPLNPTTPDAFDRLSRREAVKFGKADATTEGSYDSIDFQDATIGAVTVILPTHLYAKYSADATEVRFDFEGNADQLVQLLLWNIPQELSTPKSLRVKGLTFSAEGTHVILSNTVNTGLLEMQLYTAAPSAAQGVTLASAEKLSASEALFLLAANTTYCCQGNCYRDDGTVGSEEEVNKRYEIIKRMVPPNSGTCSIRTVGKEPPPLGTEYTVVAGGFLTLEAASDAMNTKYKAECTPPKQPTTGAGS